MAATFQMRRLLGSGVVAALLCAFAISAEGATTFTIAMDASQELGPGSTSPGIGTGTLTLNQDAEGYHLRFEVLFDGTYNFTSFGGGGTGGSELPFAMHFHANATGEIGPIVFGLIMPNNDSDADLTFAPSGGGTLVSGEWDSGEGDAGADLDDFVTALLTANPGQEVSLYLNLHTTSFVGGSIRGQVIATEEVPALGAIAKIVLVGLVALSQAARTGRR